MPYRLALPSRLRLPGWAPRRAPGSVASMSTRSSAGRIGTWSASHPWLALIVWAGFVAACLALGAATGTKALSDGAAGETARGNAIMNQQNLWPPPREYAYFHSGRLVSTDPGFAVAVRDAERRIAGLGLLVSQ